MAETVTNYAANIYLTNNQTTNNDNVEQQRWHPILSMNPVGKIGVNHTNKGFVVMHYAWQKNKTANVSVL